MSIDHQEFVTRHHQTVELNSEVVPSSNRYVWLFPAFALIFFCIAAVLTSISFQRGELSGFWSGLSMFIIGLGIFLIYRSHHMFLAKDRELSLIRSIFEGSRAARIVTGKKRQTIHTNRKFDHLCRGVGPPAYETLLRLFEDHDNAEAHLDVLVEDALQGLTKSFELFSRHEDRERWLMVTAQPVNGFPQYVHWRIDDVTDKYTLDQAIREERNQLIEFTDNAPVGFFSVNEAGRFIFANATFARWLGEDLNVLLEHGVLHTYLASPPVNGKPYDLTEQGKNRQIVELMMKGPGGKTFLASINQVVVHDDNGAVTTRAVVHDLTNEREMRMALKESEARFQRFFEEAPVGILLLDTDDKISDCNGTFSQMLGKPVNEIEGQPLKNLIHEDNRQSALDALKAMGEDDKTSAPVEIVLKGKNRNIDTQMHARRFKETGHRVLHFIDVTEQKSLETQFVQSQKMQAIGQLAGGVAHDFNNLLTAIIGFCDLLLLRHKPGDPSFGDIMQIKQNSNRAANLVRQLLAFSRQQTLRPRVHDITNILTEVSHLLRRLIGAGISLELVHGQDLGLIRVDEGQMEQVLINLAVNARDAMDAEGALKITTENFTNMEAVELVSEELPSGQWVRIAVQDTGSGIPKENLSRIFEPFFTTKDIGHGTGLGLATVYGIIRQTGGYLDVQSKLDQGASFILYLPRVNEEEEEEEQSLRVEEDSKPKDLTGTERILLVEDEDAVRSFSQRALSAKGYDVLDADCGDSALNLMNKQENKHLDLLITDVVMPGIDGPTLAQRLRQNNEFLKIVFISGYTEDRLKDYMGPNTWFLPKPFTLKQLAEKVKDALQE